MAASKSVPPGSSFAFATAVASLQEQHKRIDALDTKAGVTLAAAGVFAGLVFRGDSILFRGPKVVGIAGTAALMASTLGALLAFATRSYRTAPAAHTVASMMSFPEDWLRWRFLGNVLEAIEVNRSKLVYKARLLAFAQAELLVAVGIIGGYFIYKVAF